MTKPKKLIEVAMPIREISAESVRDKSIRHGHISTLHLWWARRPLPVCRAVVFASLVPDPLDPNCPPTFGQAVEQLLGKKQNPGDPYQPYIDIPHTAAVDIMPDNLRNRLLMFIGKFSASYLQNERLGKATPAKNQLADGSLIKWDNKNNETIIGKARQLIWVAHNAHNGQKVDQLLANYQKHNTALKKAEATLYALPNRHQGGSQVEKAEKALQKALDTFLEQMPRVFDPFAGGGAIPLEAARLGCRSYGNDINPVAHIIQKGSLEFPQKYGKPIVYSKQAFINQYELNLEAHKGQQVELSTLNQGTLEIENWKDYEALAPLLLTKECQQVHIANRLAFDVEYYAKKLLHCTEQEVGHLYPADKNGHKPIAYYWVYYAQCTNPSCRAHVPLLKDYYLVKKSGKSVFLKATVNNKEVRFSIQSGRHNQKPTFQKRKLACPICESITDDKELKQQFKDGSPIKKLVAVIGNSDNGKKYRLPNANELGIEEKIPRENEIKEEITKNDTRSLWLTLWGVDTWGDLFSNRQLHFLNNLALKINKTDFGEGDGPYNASLKTMLAIWFDRIAIVETAFGRWDVTRETLQHPYSRQGIAMMFDFPEANPFSQVTGGAINMLNWVTRYIISESLNSFCTQSHHASSGEKSQFSPNYLDATVTDPPYYDAVPYADLSDFFYVWLKRTIGQDYPLNFATPKTPKTDECTALKHRHGGEIDRAKAHFETKLLEIFEAIEHQTSDMVSIMFAHQSTEAWTTLCNSILGANMNITGSWAVDTEMANRSIGLAGAALESSVTVACKPSQKNGFGDFQEVKKAIEQTVEEEVAHLYSLGFRGADLLTACFGKAVREFGQYETVEKADGNAVTVAELLELARTAAFNALLKGFDGDEPTKFYIGWLQLYGFEQTDFDDAAKFSRVGFSINVQNLFAEHLLLKNGNHQGLATFAQRLEANAHIGSKAQNHLIDLVQRAMWLYELDRQRLLHYLSQNVPSAEHAFWRVLTSLVEVLPASSKDAEVARQLLTNQENLLRDSKTLGQQKPTQEKLFE